MLEWKKSLIIGRESLLSILFVLSEKWCFALLSTHVQLFVVVEASLRFMTDGSKNG